MKSFNLLMIAVLSNPALATTLDHCQTPPFKQVDDLKSLVATQTVECPTADEVFMKEMRDEFEKLKASGTTTKTIGGKKFSGSNAELEFLSETLEKNPPKSWATAKKDCSTAMCALKTMLGNEDTAKMLVLTQKKSGYTVKLDQAEGRTSKGIVEHQWTLNEAKLLYKISKTLPSTLQSLKGLDGIWRIPPGYGNPMTPNAAAYATPRVTAAGITWDAGQLVLLDGTFNSREHNHSGHGWDEHAIVHEICHHKDFQNIYKTLSGHMGSEAPGSSWQKLSGWKKVGSNGQEKWVHSNDPALNKFVSSYAATEPAEDYAETCSDYLLDPARLKKVAPEKYDWMKKNAFNNEEFIDAKFNIKPENKPWPELDKLLAAKTDCVDMISKCLENVQYQGGIFSMSAQGSKSQWSESEFMQKNPCIQTNKNDWIKMAVNQLSSDPSYCEKGAEKTIQLKSSELCKKDWEPVLSTIKNLDQAVIDEVINDCVDSKKDLRRECVVDGYVSKKGVNPALKNLMGKMLPTDVLQKMASKAMKKVPSGKMVKSCLSPFTSAMIPSSGKSDDIYFSFKNDGSYSTGWKLESASYWDVNDQTKACLEGVRSNLAADGYKGAETLPVGSMKTLYDTSGVAPVLKEFQQVMIEAHTKAYSCMYPGCQLINYRKSLKAWAGTDPDRLAMIEDKAFTKKVFGWIKW